MKRLHKVYFTKQAQKLYKGLPLNIQEKTDKQVLFLARNYRHPSLRARKMGVGNAFEARIDIHYRFTFQVIGEDIYINTIGQHDRGLGKK